MGLKVSACWSARSSVGDKNTVCAPPAATCAQATIATAVLATSDIALEQATHRRFAHQRPTHLRHGPILRFGELEWNAPQADCTAGSISNRRATPPRSEARRDRSASSQSTSSSSASLRCAGRWWLGLRLRVERRRIRNVDRRQRLADGARADLLPQRRGNQIGDLSDSTVDRCAHRTPEGLATNALEPPGSAARSSPACAQPASRDARSSPCRDSREPVLQLERSRPRRSASRALEWLETKPASVRG